MEHVKEKKIFVCPMHPEVMQDHPGLCLECGMNLIPAKQKKQSGAMDVSIHEKIDRHGKNRNTDSFNKHEGHYVNIFKRKF